MTQLHLVICKRSMECTEGSSF